MRISTRLNLGNVASQGFPGSVGALEDDNCRMPIVIMLVGVALLTAWLIWFFIARISRYEVTDAARIEVNQASYSFQAAVSGRVVSSRVLLAQPVQAGEVLIEIDSDPQRLQQEEEQVRLAALSPRIAMMEKQLTAIGEAQRQEERASSVAFEQAQAQFTEAETLAAFAEQEADRLSRLDSQGLISEREFRQGMTEAKRRRASAEGLRLAASRLKEEQKTRERDRQAELDRLQAEINRLRGDQSASAKTVERLKHEIARRHIRAPISGTIGQVVVLRPGAFVNEGDELGTIVPSGKLQVVAEFLAPAALGRIRPGQSGRLRLHGYPWAQYGSDGCQCRH